MKCPGCSFVCSHLRDICPECLIDLRPHKKSLGLPITNSDASYSELIAKLQRTPGTRAASSGSSTSSESQGIAARFLKSIGGLFGSKSSVPPSAIPPYSPTSVAVAAALPAGEEQPEASPSVIEDRIAKWITDAGQSTQSQATLGSSSPMTFKRHPLADMQKHVSQGVTLRDNSRPKAAEPKEALREIPPIDETPAEESPFGARPSEELLQEILEELPVELDSQEPETHPDAKRENADTFGVDTYSAASASEMNVPPPSNTSSKNTREQEPETVLLVTSNTFPSLTYSTGPVFQWVVPIEASELADEDDHEGSAGVDAHVDTIEDQAFAEEHQEQPRAKSPISTLYIRDTNTPSAAPDIERSFIAAQHSLDHTTVTSELDLSGIVSFTDTERESTLLLFGRCQDLLEGRTAVEVIDDVVTSEHRTVDAAALSAQLEQVERTIEKASSGVALGKLGVHKDPAAVTAKMIVEVLPATGLRRLIAGIFDLLVVWLLSASLAGAFERGGLPAVVAEISIDGLQKIHYPLILSSLAFAPAVAIAYLFIGYVITGASLCGRMFSLSLQTKSGRDPKFLQLLLRAVSAPLGIAVGGYLPLLIGRASLTDRLSRTLVVRDEESDS